MKLLSPFSLLSSTFPSAVCFCGTLLTVTRTGRYPASLVFREPGLSSRQALGSTCNCLANSFPSFSLVNNGGAIPEKIPVQSTRQRLVSQRRIGTAGRSGKTSSSNMKGNNSRIAWSSGAVTGLSQTSSLSE